MFMFPQFFISLLIIFILLLAAGILGAVGNNQVKLQDCVSCELQPIRDAQT